MFYLFIILGAINIAMSVFQFLDKGAGFITGYAALKPEAQSKYNQKKVLRTSAIFHLAIGLIYIILVVSFDSTASYRSVLAIAGMLLMLTYTVYHYLKYH